MRGVHGGYLYVSKSVVAKFVHQTVKEGGGSPSIHPELPLRCKVVGLL